MITHRPFNETALLEGDLSGSQNQAISAQTNSYNDPNSSTIININNSAYAIPRKLSCAELYDADYRTARIVVLFEKTPSAGDMRKILQILYSKIKDNPYPRAIVVGNTYILTYANDAVFNKQSKIYNTSSKYAWESEYSSRERISKEIVKINNIISNIQNRLSDNSNHYKQFAARLNLVGIRNENIFERFLGSIHNGNIRESFEFYSNYRFLFSEELHDLLLKEWGFKPSATKGAHTQIYLSGEAAQLLGRYVETNLRPRYYAAIAAGQFPEIYQMVLEGKAKLTPEMLLYRPKSVGGLMGLPEPSTIELLMHQGYLPMLFTKELWQQKSPFPLVDVVLTLPRTPFENQVGTERLKALMSEINQENLDGAEQIAALINERTRIRLGLDTEEIAIIARENLAELRSGLAQVEGAAGELALTSYSASTSIPESERPKYSEQLPDGTVKLVPPKRPLSDEASAALNKAEATDHLSDTALQKELLLDLKKLLIELDSRPINNMVPVGIEPINPLRAHLLRTTEPGSPLHDLAKKTPKELREEKESKWQGRIEREAEAEKPLQRH